MIISKSGKPPASPITISKSRERLASPRDHQQVAETTGFPDNHHQVRGTEESISKTLISFLQRNHRSIGTTRALEDCVRWRKGPMAFPKPLTLKQARIQCQKPKRH